MSEQMYDVLVIGAGPGGYVCAIRAAQMGLKTALVEKRKTLGGTCLNVGCIPSKALLSASEKYHAVQHEFAAFGIRVKDPKMDLGAMMAHKESVVDANTKGIEFLLKKNKIDWIKGAGVIAAPGQVEVAGKTYGAKNIVIATGSDVSTLPGITIDEQKIVSSTGALELASVPKKMVVIGGGVIGLELGCVWSRLGATVTVVEYLDRILPGMDGELAAAAQKILTAQGLTFKLGMKVSGAVPDKNGVTIEMAPVAGGNSEKLSADIVLVAVGRRPYTEGLGLATAGVKIDERGRVVVNDHFESSVPGIYAIGDVIAGPMLAHKAEDEGYVLAEILAGQSGHINYDAIPGIVYTAPEIASVGKTEEQLKAEGVAYKVGKFPFMANGRARAMNATDGFVKILSASSDDRVLGVHIIGPEAGTLIAEVTLAIEFGASAEDIARTCHAHPTLNEVVREAAMAAFDKPVHI